MAKKQSLFQRKDSIQERRRVSARSGNTAHTVRVPLSGVTIGQLEVENNRDGGLEQGITGRDSEGTDVVRPVFQKDSQLDANNEGCKWRGLHESSSGLSSSGLPTNSLEETQRSKTRWWAYKNVYGLSLACVVLFTLSLIHI